MPKPFRSSVVAAAMLLSFTFGLSACANNPDRLPPLERQFYDILEPKQQTAFLATKPKARRAYLNEVGLWSQWVALSKEQQKAVMERRVAAGVSEFEAHMAWGLPADVQVKEARGREVRFETFIRCTSGPRVGEYVRENIACDGTSSEVRLAIENGVVVELKNLD